MPFHNLDLQVAILKVKSHSEVASYLDNRLIEHKSGEQQDGYSNKRRPIKLGFYTTFTNINLAIQSEKQIKKWSKARNHSN